MEEIPPFWRTEVWHPLTVHLPLGVLILATIFGIFELFSRKPLWFEMSRIFLLIGTAGAWLAIYTGDLADGIVSRQLCDPTVLKDHENAAYTLVWLFTSSSLIALCGSWLSIFPFNKWAKTLRVAIMLAGSGFLIYTGHLGAELVYQQAAGVYTPNEDCEGFE